MKNTFLILFLLVFIISNAQRSRKIIKENKIAELSVYKLSINTKDSLIIEQDFFDENGNAIKKLHFNEDGKIILKYIYKYENNLIAQQIGYDEFEKITSIFTYKYNENKDLIEFTELDSDGNIISVQGKKYNKLNQAIALYGRQKDSTAMILKGTYKNYKEGKFNVVTSYNAKGDLIATKKSEYDKNEKIIKFIEINKRETQTISCSYNDKKLLIEKVIKSDRIKNLERKVKYNYDLNSNLIEEITYENDIPKSVERYHYQKFGT